MPDILEYSDIYESRWAEFVDGCPGANIAHLPKWGKVIEEGLGHKAKYLLAVDGEKVIGVLPLFMIKTWTLSRYMVSIPWIDYGGVCAKDIETEKLLLSEAKRMAVAQKAKYIEFRSINVDPHISNFPNLYLRRDKVTFLLELDGDLDVMMKKFDSKLRNQIRKAKKSGLTTEFAGIEKLHDFYKIFAWRMRGLGTPVWGVKFFETILKTFPTSARVALVKKDDKYIAAGLILAFKDRLYVPSAASYSDYLRYCPNQELYWKIIKSACEQGYKYFDFGRSSWNSPTFNFKKQWVATPLQLTWQYHLNTAKNPPFEENGHQKYAPFIAMWKRLPLPVANMLGPKVIKNFP
jgi:serine/alanine adding enzyme